MRSFKFFAMIVSTLVFLAACGESGPKKVTIQPVGNEMKYATTEFTVKAGEQVTLIMDNVATSPAMIHNVVVLKPGTDVDAFAQACLAAGESAGYFADDPNVVAHVPLAKPGKKTQVTFTAPTEKGDYMYICTYPGHYVLMRGTMHVQ
ncbi:MAG: hypothetical protein D6677_03170 [Calditrichaeota bacterium]|nr:MAG: hypothetical protein D6677_03170 [Calditrichota bacterium]